MAPAQRHLLRESGSREALKAVVVVMKALFHRDQRKGGDGEDDLQALHAELVRAWCLLPPLRGRATAQPADLREDDQIQQGANEREDDHWDAERIGMEAAHHSARSRTEGEGSQADGEAQTICRSKEGTDALQESEEETRPGDSALNAYRTFSGRISRREGPDWSRCHENTPRRKIAFHCKFTFPGVIDGDHQDGGLQ
jgi:hypothetical protein